VFRSTARRPGPAFLQDECQLLPKIRPRRGAAARWKPGTSGHDRAGANVLTWRSSRAFWSQVQDSARSRPHEVTSSRRSSSRQGGDHGQNIGVACHHARAFDRKAIAEKKQTIRMETFLQGFISSLLDRPREPTSRSCSTTTTDLNFLSRQAADFAVGAAAEYRNEDEGWAFRCRGSIAGDPALSWHLIQRLSPTNSHHHVPGHAGRSTRVTFR